MDSAQIINKFVFSNPFAYRYFPEIMVRLGIILGAGVLVVFIFNIRKPGNTFRSTAFQKLIGWLFISPLFLFSIMCGGIFAIALISFIVIMCLKEYTDMFTLPKFYFFALIGIWFTSVIIMILLNIFFKKTYYIPFIYTLPILYLLSISMISIFRGRIEEVMKKVAYSYFASIWICFSMIHFLLLYNNDLGKELLIITGFSVALSDVFAFIIGKFFDAINFGTRFKIAENISPNKNYAGITGNALGAALGIYMLNFMLPQFNLFSFILLAVIIGTASNVGDMLESLVKRAAGIKDASKAIFGHGGFLDRVDSLLIVIIIVYYYFLFFTDYIK